MRKGSFSISAVLQWAGECQLWAGMWKGGSRVPSAAHLSMQSVELLLYTALCQQRIAEVLRATNTAAAAAAADTDAATAAAAAAEIGIAALLWPEQGTECVQVASAALLSFVREWLESHPDLAAQQQEPFQWEVWTGCLDDVVQLLWTLPWEANPPVQQLGAAAAGTAGTAGAAELLGGEEQRVAQHRAWLDCCAIIELLAGQAQKQALPSELALQAVVAAVAGPGHMLVSRGEGMLCASWFFLVLRAAPLCPALPLLKRCVVGLACGCVRHGAFH